MNVLIKDTETRAPIELVGGKARGLLKLKSLEKKLNEEVVWGGGVIVPHFFIVPPLVDLVKGYDEIIDMANSLGSESYAVRSSSALEDNGEHSFDGIFETQLNVPKNRLTWAINNVRESVKSERATRYAEEVGAKLDGRMSVIVQTMVDGIDNSGVVYSKFPAARDIVKVIRDSVHDGERYIEAFLRKGRGDENIYADRSPLVLSRYYSGGLESETNDLANIALFVERRIKHPVIIEFATCFDDSLDCHHYLLQARKLTKLSEAEKFQMPELQEKGLVAMTYDLNGTGDFTGEAFSITDYSSLDGAICIDGIEEFDRNHSEGYILVTPYLQFYYHDYLDDLTPNKKAIVAYTDLGEHHDMELSRKKEVLYLNAKHSLNQLFYNGREHEDRFPIETGEKVRVISDGEAGYVFNLSRD